MLNIKLICFDLDKTLITKNSWYDLNLALGVTHEEDLRLYNEYCQGKISYKEWTKKLLKLFLKSDKANLKDITKILSCYTFVDGAREIVDYVKSKGYSTALISGSINIMVDLVAKDLNIELAAAANTFIFDKNDTLKEITTYGDDKTVKLNILESFCRKLNMDIKNCICVGDGDNDIELFRKTAHGITFKNSKINNEAWKVIESLYDIRTIV